MAQVSDYRRVSEVHNTASCCRWHDTVGCQMCLNTEGCQANQNGLMVEMTEYNRKSK